MDHIKTKHSEAAKDQLVEGARAARIPDAAKAQKHFDQADLHIKDHVVYLKSIGKHKEADHDQKTYEAVKKQLMQANKVVAPKPSKPKKSKSSASKSDDSVNEIGRGIFLKAEKISTKMTLSKPAGNPRYEYKGLHELHPEDRQRVLGRAGNPSMYAGKDHHKFVYPTDSSGRLVHSQRIAAPAHHDFAAAQASAQESQHKGHQLSEGQGVRIDQPGHELHGKLGMVQLPHPLFPDKINVMFAGGRRELLDSSAIKPSSPRPQLEKAKATVIDIRSRLQKKKPNN